VRALLLLLLLAPRAAASDRHVRQLTEGVQAIGVPGVPGPLSLLGGDAFPVIVGESSGRPVPIVAATTWGRGRVVALPHGGYLGAVLETADTGRLMTNAVRWAARGRPRVGVRENPFLLGFLRRAGLRAAPFEAMQQAGAFDVVVTPTVRLDAEQVEDLRRYVRGGGGLITANLGWGWRQLNPGKDLATEHAGNRLCGPMGIVWAGGTIRVPPNRQIAVEGIPPRMVHAGWALDALAAKQRVDTAVAVFTLSRCVAELPPDDELLLPRLRRLRKKEAPVPPLSDRDALAKVLLAVDLHRDRYLPPQEIRAHPAAGKFPGAVPRRAARVKRRLEIDTRIPDWHSTGLYAPPGEVITVAVGPQAAGRELKLRLGAHHDRLWNKKTWRRAPEITRAFPLAAPVTHGAGAFGGMVYVDVPRDCDLGTIAVEIAGAVEAPTFVLGRTDPGEWRRTIRRFPAPWAELATTKVILTLPARVVRDLDDPTGLMRFWDEVLDACADLATRPRERARPERYVTDEQISAGYMHAGYPIMTHLDAAPRFVDLEKLRATGDWGMFHEMGHNHQSGDWTFHGTGEVTVNLFTLYVLDTVCTDATGHQATSAEATRKWIERYRAGGNDFAMWKREPFLALVMYRQLQDAFGWEAYRKVFAEYRALPRQQRPRTNAEKRDQWLVRFSRTVGRDLGPFFGSWGVPTSAEARRSIAHLPPWMPEEGGGRGRPRPDSGAR
jgi:hypothetical protein